VQNPTKGSVNQLPMENSITSLLQLQGFILLSLSQNEGGNELWVDLPRKDTCPYCGQESTRLHQRARQPSRILWCFLGLRPVWLVLTRRRLWCHHCQRAFTQTVPGLARKKRIGVLAVTHILQSLAEQSFSATTRSLGVSYGRAKRILLELPQPWCDWHHLVGSEEPVNLGIDEHSYRGNNLVTTLTCLSSRNLITILSDDRQQTLREALRAMPEEVRRRVAAVCIDGKESFRKVVREELPQALVVADHFHLIQDANRRLDETRRLEQAEGGWAIPRWPLLKNAEKLTPAQERQRDEILQRYPTLAAQYWVKEHLRALYRCSDWHEANQALSLILTNCREAEDAETVRWGRWLERWRTEILNYFKVRITNGYTEGCHTKIKLLKRLSYGFRNLQVYLRKMMLGFLPLPQPPHILT